MNINDVITKEYGCTDFNEPIKPGCYNIGFKSKTDEPDETQFDIYPGETLNDLVELWKQFAAENNIVDAIDEDSVEYVEYAGMDIEMKAVVRDIYHNGFVIIRDVNDENSDAGNIYLSPQDIQMFLMADRAYTGYNICLCHDDIEGLETFTADDFIAVKKELDNMLAEEDNSELEVEAIKKVLKRKEKLSNGSVL